MNQKVKILHDYNIRQISTSFTPDIRNVNTKWLLEDCSFIWVLPTDLEKQTGKQNFSNSNYNL
jgi:hypothetical protein